MAESHATSLLGPSQPGHPRDRIDTSTLVAEELVDYPDTSGTRESRIFRTSTSGKGAGSTVCRGVTVT